MSIMYQRDAWFWVSIWVNIAFTRVYSELFISEYGKILYSSSLNNGKFILILSFKGNKYHVCKGRIELEILYGFCGPAKYIAAMYAPR